MDLRGTHAGAENQHAPLERFHFHQAQEQRAQCGYRDETDHQRNTQHPASHVRLRHHVIRHDQAQTAQHESHALTRKQAEPGRPHMGLILTQRSQAKKQHHRENQRTLRHVAGEFLQLIRIPEITQIRGHVQGRGQQQCLAQAQQKEPAHGLLMQKTKHPYPLPDSAMALREPTGESIARFSRVSTRR